MTQVSLEYLGHACFRLDWNGTRIVLDPYEDGAVPGVPNLRTEAEYVYCSHDHGDHNAVQNVTLHPAPAPAFGLTELLTDHDDAGGSKRGKNIIRIFDFAGVRVAHFGDLGRPLTAEETAALRDLDCALLPVGGCFTIDAAAAADVIRATAPKLVVPMHYRTDTVGFAVLGTLAEALPVLRAAGAPVRVLEYGQRLTLEQ